MSVSDDIPSARAAEGSGEADGTRESASGTEQQTVLGGGSTLVAVFGDRFEVGHPKTVTDRSSYRLLPLAEALANEKRGAMLAQYVTPVARRLGPKSVGAFPIQTPIIALRVLDEGGIKKDRTVVRARPEWLTEQRGKLEALRAERGPCVWAVPGGYALLWMLREPFTIDDAEDVARRERLYFDLRKQLSQRYGITADADSASFSTLIELPMPGALCAKGDIRSFVDRIERLTIVTPTPGAKKLAADDDAPRAKADDLLRQIARDSYERGVALCERDAAMLLADCSGDMPDRVRWTQYEGGKFDTLNGAARSEPFAMFASELQAYSQTVAKKGAGRVFIGAVCRNGRCRDADVEAVTLLTLDCDGAGEWTRLRGVLDEARLAYIAQRSSSHTPEQPRWHVTIPLARPHSSEKPAWRAIWRFNVGFFAGVAGLHVDMAGGSFGFDHTTDRLGQPIFPAAKCSKEQNVPETIYVTGRALDLDEFLVKGGSIRHGTNRERRTIRVPRQASTHRTVCSLWHSPRPACSVSASSARA